MGQFCHHQLTYDTRVRFAQGLRVALSMALLLFVYFWPVPEAHLVDGKGFGWFHHNRLVWAMVSVQSINSVETHTVGGVMDKGLLRLAGSFFGGVLAIFADMAFGNNALALAVFTFQVVFFCEFVYNHSPFPYAW